jgi:hypothetical protein
MIRLLKTSFVWQFAGGFVLGAVGLLALHPADTDPYQPAPTAAQATLQ